MAENKDRPQGWLEIFYNGEDSVLYGIKDSSEVREIVKKAKKKQNFDHFNVTAV